MFLPGLPVTGLGTPSCAMTTPAPRGPAPVTCALRAAGVLRARRVLAEQRRAHLCLTHHPPAVAGALRTGVYVPRFSFHEVLSSRGVANGGVAELWLLHHKVIWGRHKSEHETLFISSHPNAWRTRGCGFKGQRWTDCGLSHSVPIGRAVREINARQQQSQR